MKISRELLLESLTVEVEKKDKMGILAFLPFALTFIWILLLFISPLILPPNTVYLGNEGKVGIMDNSQYINAHISNPIIRGVYLSGDYMCHQHSNRSFFINGNQMPYCARCTGIFLGLSFGFLVGALYRVRVGFALYILLVIPLALDGMLQLITPYESTNLTRIITGNLAGTFSSLIFAYVYYDTKQPFHRRESSLPDDTESYRFE